MIVNRDAKKVRPADRTLSLYINLLEGGCELSSLYEKDFNFYDVSIWGDYDIVMHKLLTGYEHSAKNSCHVA